MTWRKLVLYSGGLILAGLALAVTMRMTSESNVEVPLDVPVTPIPLTSEPKRQGSVAPEHEENLVLRMENESLKQRIRLLEERLRLLEETRGQGR